MKKSICHKKEEEEKKRRKPSKIHLLGSVYLDGKSRGAEKDHKLHMELYIFCFISPPPYFSFKLMKLYCDKQNQHFIKHERCPQGSERHGGAREINLDIIIEHTKFFTISLKSFECPLHLEILKLKQ